MTDLRQSSIGSDESLSHRVIHSGRQAAFKALEGSGSSGGPFTDYAEEFLRSHLGAVDVLLTTSCTAALEMTALLLDPDPGDTVIVPSFGYVTTALAFVRAGFEVRFADVEMQTLGLDPTSVGALMDDRVRAVVPIHYAGMSADMTGLREVIEPFERCSLIEDNAHSLFGTMLGRPLGSFGTMSTLSFHDTKNISCGEGGALVVNQQSLQSRARIVYEKGTDRSRFLNGEVDKYQWLDLGSSFALSEYLAAILWSRLELAPEIQAHRRSIHELYDSVLRPEAMRLGVTLPHEREGASSAHHIYWTLLPDASLRTELLRRLREVRVPASSHYVPLHTTPAGGRWAYGNDCPHSTDAAQRLVRLPLDHTISESEAKRNAEMFVSILSGLTS